jgi:hypothetical protein
MRAGPVLALVILGCGHPNPAAIDASDDDARDAARDSAADSAADAAAAAFWPTCGTAAIDQAFLDGDHSPVVIGYDGTLYGPSRTVNGGTAIARKRPGLPAEDPWVTVASFVHAIEALAASRDGMLYMTGYVGTVHGVYAVTPAGALTMLGDPLPGVATWDLAAAGAGGMYVAQFGSRDILRVDLATGGRTVAIPGDSATSLLDFSFDSPTTMIVSSENTGSYRVALDASGNQVSTTPATAFGSEQVTRWGLDASGRIYGQVIRNNVEALVRIEPGTGTQTVLTGNWHWSDFAFGKGALRCDIAITSVNSPIDTVIASDQTPSVP